MIVFCDAMSSVSIRRLSSNFLWTSIQKVGSGSRLFDVRGAVGAAVSSRVGNDFVCMVFKIYPVINFNCMYVCKSLRNSCEYSTENLARRNGARQQSSSVTKTEARRFCCPECCHLGRLGQASHVRIVFFPCARFPICSKLLRSKIVGVATVHWSFIEWFIETAITESRSCKLL